MRVVFSIIGAVLGLSLASSSHELFGVLLGGFAGFGIAELGALRVKLKELEDELAALPKFAALQPRPADTPTPVRPVAPDSVRPTSPQPGSASGQPVRPTSPQ